MSRRLDGTVALITGAASGIGRATALGLAREGASVALVGRRADQLATLAEEISAAGGQSLVVPTDISDPRAAAEAVDRTVEGLGRLDTLVNHAQLGRHPAADRRGPGRHRAAAAPGHRRRHRLHRHPAEARRPQ